MYRETAIENVLALLDKWDISDCEGSAWHVRSRHSRGMSVEGYKPMVGVSGLQVLGKCFLAYTSKEICGTEYPVLKKTIELCGTV